MNLPDISQDSTIAQTQSSKELPNAPTRLAVRCSARSSVSPKYCGQEYGT